MRTAARQLVDHLRRARDPRNHTPLLPDYPSPARFASRLVPADELARVEQIPLRDLGHGYDAFGCSREGIALGLALSEPLYRYWFRVRGYHRERIPGEGPVVIAANHSGTLPIDGMMIWADIVRKAPTPRLPRVIVDYFVGQLPWVSEIFTRGGAIGGARGNFHELLSQGEMIVVFPEGTKGVGKPFSKRYQLQEWTEGHAELAIRHGAPILPVAVVGAEEQMPQVARLDFLHPFGSPFLPIPATLVPLPVRYHLWYGEPIPVHREFSPDQASDPAVVGEVARRVRDAVQALIEEGLAARKGVFL